MHRVIGLVLLLALLAHVIPLSSLALELPVTEEPAAEPEGIPETIPEDFPILPEEIVEPLSSEETTVGEAPLLEESVPELQMLLSEAPSFEPSVNGIVVAKSPSWTWDSINWDGLRYAPNMDYFFAPNVIQEGTFTHLVMPLRFYGNVETRFAFIMRDVYGQHMGCVTPEKSAAEWGLEAYESGSGGYNMITIGPFAEGCDMSRHYTLYATGDGYSRVALPGGTVDGMFSYPYLFYIESEGSQLCDECASNVLFIPGIKGSRLYVDNGEEEKVWDPLGNDDIHALFLDEEGRSLQRVYTKDGDVLGTIAGFIDIYQGFLDSLGSLANNDVINNWEVVAYDWRLSLDEIVTTGVEEGGRIYYGEASSTPYIEQTLRSLAASSKTGKVTIVAHSNGGLVTKALLLHLGDEETSTLVDKIVFVGVPQSGAPQALGALLFGYKEGLPWWFPFMVSPATAREMAENSPMGYHLLPTQNYFDSVMYDGAHPVARFNAQSLYAPERSAYGNELGTQDELFAFLRSDEGGRTKPAPEDYHLANVLGNGLLGYAQDVHSSIDAWRPPADVQLYQVAGWGEDTISGVEFYEECISTGCKPKYRPMFVEDGDGVVPIPSTLMMEEAENIKRYWADLNFMGGDHGNILSRDALRELIRGFIQNDSEIPQYISESQPTNSGSRKLIFILHSPLTLEANDQYGGRTGANIDGSKEEQIPGSSYGRFGEVQYLILPAGEKYKIEMYGTGNGVFSLDIQEYEGGQILRTSTISNLPASLETYAYFSIENGVDDVSPISIDPNGDGEVNIEVSFVPNQTSEYIPEKIHHSSRGIGANKEKDKKLFFEFPVEMGLSPKSEDSVEVVKTVVEVSQETSEVMGVQITNKSEISTTSPSWLNTFLHRIYSVMHSYWNFFIKILGTLF